VRRLTVLPSRPTGESGRAPTPLLACGSDGGAGVGACPGQLRAAAHPDPARLCDSGELPCRTPGSSGHPWWAWACGAPAVPRQGHPVRATTTWPAHTQ